MQLLFVEFDPIYSWTSDSEESKTRAKAQKAKRAANLKAVGVELFVDEGEEPDMESPKLTVTNDQFIRLSILGEQMKVKGSNSPVFDGFDSTLQRLNAIVGKLETFGTSAGPGQFNEKVEVYTPGMGLMLFNRVMLLEDACSDALQTELDNGWKIIAACPQPNQRRPDYILGRYDPTHADESGKGSAAMRGTPTPVRSTYETPPDHADFL